MSDTETTPQGQREAITQAARVLVAHLQGYKAQTHGRYVDAWAQKPQAQPMTWREMWGYEEAAC